MRKKQSIHQTLHGYDGGHRLLASSSPLTNVVERHLLELTDLSGSRVDGFDEYFTGYRIPNTDTYAFSKTWYAFEMERPGCVWTQTLLLEPSHVSSISSLSVLLDQMVRPIRGDYAYYKDVVEIPEGDGTVKGSTQDLGIWPSSEGFELYAAAFQNLFERIRRIIVFASHDRRYDQLALGIWSQLWASLRLDFSFCTASFSNRYIGRQAFTLQIAPAQNIGAFRSSLAQDETGPRSTGTSLIDASNFKPPRLSQERYVRIYETFLNLIQGNNSGEDFQILEFVKYFGDKLPPYRKNFGWLVRLYDLIDAPEPNLEEIAVAIEAKFGDKVEQKELKHSLFGARSNSAAKVSRNGPLLRPLAPESDLLKFLLYSNHTKSLDVVELDLPNRFAAIWSDQAAFASDLLQNLPESETFTEIQNEFLSVAANNIDGDLFQSILISNPKLADRLLAGNIGLAKQPAVWKLDESLQDEVFDLVSKKHGKAPLKKRAEKLWKDIVWAMLSAGNDRFVGEISEIVNQRLPAWILDWSSEQAGFELSFGRWNDFLWHDEKKLVQWAAHNPSSLEVLAGIARYLNPNSKEVRRDGSALWLHLATSELSSLPEPVQLDVSVFLTALGLGDTDVQSYELLSESFSIVYDAANSNRIQYWNWQRLEGVVPNGGIIWGWDRCRRLEEAVIARVLDRGWPTEILLRTAKSEFLLWRLVDRAAGYSRMRKALWRLSDRIRSNDMLVPAWQAEVLERYLN